MSARTSLAPALTLRIESRKARFNGLRLPPLLHSTLTHEQRRRWTPHQRKRLHFREVARLSLSGGAAARLAGWWKQISCARFQSQQCTERRQLTSAPARDVTTSAPVTPRQTEPSESRSHWQRDARRGRGAISQSTRRPHRPGFLVPVAHSPQTRGPLDCSCVAPHAPNRSAQHRRSFESPSHHALACQRCPMCARPPTVPMAMSRVGTPAPSDRGLRCRRRRSPR